MSERDYIFLWSRAIILAHVSQKARKSLAFTESLTVMGTAQFSLEMFFMAENGTQISEAMFVGMREALEYLVANLVLTDEDEDIVSQQHALLNLLYIY